MELIKRLIKGEEGQGLVEYALIIAIIAVALIATLGLLKTGIANTFTKATTELNK